MKIHTKHINFQQITVPPTSASTVLRLQLFQRGTQPHLISTPEGADDK